MSAFGKWEIGAIILAGLRGQGYRVWPEGEDVHIEYEVAVSDAVRELVNRYSRVILGLMRAEETAMVEQAGLIVWRGER